MSFSVDLFLNLVGSGSFLFILKLLSVRNDCQHCCAFVSFADGLDTNLK